MSELISESEPDSRIRIGYHVSESGIKNRNRVSELVSGIGIGV